MTDATIDNRKPPPRPLDESLYAIHDEALQFMQQQTGIQDPEEIKRHIIAVQAEAYAVCAAAQHPLNVD